MAPAPDTLIVNPLYRVAVEGDQSVLTLTFPTEEYGQEFEAVKRYLPETVVVPGNVRTEGIDLRLIGNERFEDLCRRMVFISAPEHYV